jgi:hypothetical protein
MERMFLMLCAALFLFAGCSTKTTVQVPRHPLMQFNYDALLWTDTRYLFETPFQVVAYPADTLLPGGEYTRYSLQAVGQDSKGNTLQLNIVFDVSDAAQLVGTYKPAYTAFNGLAQVQLFNLGNNSFSDYGLCSNDTTSIFQIQRQSETEKLIAGNFQMSLCNARDTSQKIFITNGILTDINY